MPLNYMVSNILFQGEYVVMDCLLCPWCYVRFMCCLIHFTPSKAGEGRGEESGTTDSIVNPSPTCEEITNTLQIMGMILRSHCARNHSAIQ